MEEEYLSTAGGDKLAEPYALPKGWLWARLGEIAEITMGNSPPGSSYNTIGLGLPLINGPTEFGPGAFDHPEARQFTDEFTRTCLPGDLLICVRGSTTGRTNVASFEAAIGRGVASIRGLDLQPYLNHYISSQGAALLAISSGSTFPSISIAQLRLLAVPLPPLNEQARIVAAIEVALADIDVGITHLVHAKNELPRLRASILHAAVSGGLGSQHRETVDDPELETSSDASQAHNSAEPIFQPSLLDGDNVAKPGEREAPLPRGWRWTNFGKACEVRLGRSKSPSNRPGRFATPYLRAANINEDGLDITDVQEMDFPPPERETYRLRAGDLVVAEASGSSSQVGKPAMWNDELELCCYQNTVIRLRPVAMEGAFVLTLLQHCYFNGVFSGLSAGVGINHLGASRLSGIRIPMPPRAEQKQIAKEVEAQLTSITQSRLTIDRSLQHAEQLRRSVWMQAFTGELLERPEVSESAEPLLQAAEHRRRSNALIQSPASSRSKPTIGRPHSVRRTLIDILHEYPDGIQPERLFLLSGYNAEQIDDFYAELASIADRLLEEKPTGEEAFTWPRQPLVTVRLKGV